MPEIIYRVVLIFPDTISLADFVFEIQIPGIETSLREQSFSGCLTEEQVNRAVHQFGAYVRVCTPL